MKTKGSKNRFIRLDKGIIKKQFCPSGHDKLITGMYTDGHCKLCHNNRSTIRHEKLHDEINYKRRLKYKIFGDTYIKSKDQKNRKKITDKEWFKKNRSSVNARKLKDETNRNLRIVDWTDFDHIVEFYKNCPKRMVVDHVIPLQGKKVSGLHVSWNLQYLTPPENRKKYNNFDGTLENNSWKNLSYSKEN